MATGKTRKTAAKKAVAPKPTAAKKVATQKVAARLKQAQALPETPAIEVISTAGQQPVAPQAIDMGWVFYFSVHTADVNAAWGILSDRLSGKAVRTGKLTAAEYFGTEFTPRAFAGGSLFVLRITQDSSEDLGMLAGEIEDAFRDAGIRPGPMLPDTRTIEGVQFTYYRNEADADGRMLLPAEIAAMRAQNPFLVMYNPFGKADPWDDLYYEYRPSVEDVPSETAAFRHMEPAEERLTQTLDVEDFDHDLGNLLNQVFSGVSARYLTQPEGLRGWVFDKGFGRAGKPSYRFYACPETIKPVRKTLNAAGFAYEPDIRGDWHGVQLPLETFKTIQRTLSDRTKLDELHEFFKATAQATGDNVPALSAPEKLPFAEDTLFVSDL